MSAVAELRCSRCHAPIVGMGNIGGICHNTEACKRRRAKQGLPPIRKHCNQPMRYEDIPGGDVFDGQKLTGTYYCERCCTMQPTYERLSA